MTQPSTDSQSLARAEKDAASQLDMGQRRWVLVGCAAAYLVALCLPFAGDASGWQVLGASGAAKDAHTAITEYLFAWFSLLGLGVLTSLAVAVRRFSLTVAGWALTTVSLVFSVLGIWLRNSGGTGIGRGAGYYLAMLAVALAVFTLFPLIWSRSDAQADIARERAEAQQRDEAAYAPMVPRHENPLLIDDRRARAAERHRRRARSD